MKHPQYDLLVTVLAICLTSCDWYEEADGIADEEPFQSMAERGPRGIVLSAPERSYVKGSRMRDFLELEMENLTVKMEQGDQEIGGKADYLRRETREVEVLAPSIWKISLDDASRTIKTTTWDKQVAKKAVSSALADQVIIRDGDEVSLEGLATDEQKEELERFQPEWFGGNRIFPDEPVKPREQWEVKAEDVLGAIMGEVVTGLSGSATFEVEKTLTFDKRKTAKVHVSINRCRGTTSDKDGAEWEIELTGSGKIHRCLEPLYTTQVEITGHAKLIVKELGVTTTFEGPFECRANSSLTTP